jgi:anti-sigma B factor antagonist
MFELKLEDNGEIVATGRFDASQVQRATSFFDDLTASHTIDMQGLDYISSAGLGVLVATQQRLKQEGEKLTLINVNDRIREIFRCSRLDSIFEME